MDGNLVTSLTFEGKTKRDIDAPVWISPLRQAQCEVNETNRDSCQSEASKCC